jgi:hypothetical protein
MLVADTNVLIELFLPSAFCPAFGCLSFAMCF